MIIFGQNFVFLSNVLQAKKKAFFACLSQKSHLV